MRVWTFQVQIAFLLVQKLLKTSANLFWTSAVKPARLLTIATNIHVLQRDKFQYCEGMKCGGGQSSDLLLQVWWSQGKWCLCRFTSVMFDLGGHYNHAVKPTTNFVFLTCLYEIPTPKEALNALNFRRALHSAVTFLPQEQTNRSCGLFETKVGYLAGK